MSQASISEKKIIKIASQEISDYLYVTSGKICWLKFYLSSKCLFVDLKNLKQDRTLTLGIGVTLKMEVGMHLPTTAQRCRSETEKNTR